MSKASARIRKGFKHPHSQEDQLWREVIDRLNQLDASMRIVQVQNVVLDHPSDIVPANVVRDSTGEPVTDSNGEYVTTNNLWAFQVSVDDTDDFFDGSNVATVLAEIGDTREVALTGTCQLDLNAGIQFTWTTVAGSTSITLINPRVGDVATLIFDDTADGGATLPGTCTVIRGAHATGVNYYMFMCTDATTPAYLVTISQEVV